ncbi:MAG: transcriptional regulator [Alteromonadaceae bacterium]|nr:transcriptional regulator [Alteromonadaceae bacterium]
MAQPEPIDTLDRKLLRALQRDSAEPISDLAERCGLSRSACSRRIARLAEAGVIERSVTLLSQSKLGLGLTVFIAIKTNQHNAAWSSQFRRVVEQLPGILEVHRLGGDIDYLVKAVVPDMPGYDALYQQLIKADLFDVSASFVMETMKHTTELPL